MALQTSSIYTAAVGHIFTAPVGTAAPTPAAVDGFVPSAGLGSPWENIGHTARDELPVFGFEGGETETRGTWQAAVVKTVVTEPPADFVTFNVHQFDESNLEYYYGAENLSSTAGVYEAPVTGIGGATQRALCIVIVDGDTSLAFHAPKVEIRREDSIELAIDEFAFMPLRATIVANDGSEVLFSWISSDTMTIAS